MGERRGLARPRKDADDAAVERVVQRIGTLDEFSDAQIRQIAAIALVALSVDDVDRQRRDETARENRRRLRSLGRD
ncbi:MAG TPA: hypothetical protein VFJ21_09235 [Mycobacteriales bacterium]|nr:hypothetical protein [Mycobacteriales bacterium]